MKLAKIGGGVTAAKGFQAGGIHVGVKKTDQTKKDLALIYSEVPAVAAGVFTTNKVQAAPVLVSKEHLKTGTARAAIVNSGNANACNGERGLADARAMAEAAAEALSISPEEVLVASTGVIGVSLPMEAILPGVRVLADSLSADGSPAAAEAIMTTDTFAKEIAIRFDLGGVPATIGAIAKGSGMIHPNMATLLCFVTTDAAIEQSALKEALRAAADVSFNMLTVDGDTSTNDTLVALANGQAGNKPVCSGSPEMPVFTEALTYICVEMAKALARDGEGATKLLEVRVSGARDVADARKAAISVAKSSLVKTALFGADANWGRILCAVGYSGAEFNPAQVDLYLEDRSGQAEQMMAKGTALIFSEEQAALILNQKEVLVRVELNQGQAGATAWGCDLSYDYVKINGDYRT